jgi:hypothetical protein
MLLPEPFIGIPVTEAWSLVQLNVVPGTLLNKLIILMGEPEQLDCTGTLVAPFGTGFTTTVEVTVVPVQVVPALV